MKDKKRNKQIILIALLVLGLISITLGITYAFFNYTRTGLANTFSTGRIYFNTTQNGTFELTDIFPLTSLEAENANLNSVSVTITGDTTYTDGEEFKITLVDVNNTINGKVIPINYTATYTANTGGIIGTSNNDYWNARNSKDASIYTLTGSGSVEENKQVLVGYIDDGATGINGTLTIKAYIDGDKVAISDTYDGTESDINGTTTSWVDGRTVLTTTEWNSFRTSGAGISFKIRAESNEGIWVEEPLTGEKMVRRAITAKINAQTNSCNPIWVDNMDTPDDESDDITYFSGTNDCVDMNYVWYSGKLWRITAIYPDGAMKLVTQNNITSIAFNEDGQVNFEGSYMYKWLNEEFYPTLYNAEDIIDNTKKWNATMPANTTISTRPGNDNMVSANVGLLNSYEYYNSYRCVGSSACTGSTYGTGYLNIGYYCWLLNPYSTSLVWLVSLNDSGNYAPTNANGARPSIYLKSGLEFTGSGTSSSPYRIVGDKDTGRDNDLVNTRLSGEYVKLKNGNSEQIFRIIGIEDGNTKIIAMDYADNEATKMFGIGTGAASTLWGSGTTTGEGTWYTYLNTPITGYFAVLQSTYGDLFTSGTYYLGTSGYNYKLSVCANTTSGNTKVCDKTNRVIPNATNDNPVYIGLPRYGEMFATQQAGGSSSSMSMWLINRYSASSNSNSLVWYVGYNGLGSYGTPAYAYGARPTVHLKSSVKILSGTGTESDPYVVGL